MFVNVTRASHAQIIVAPVHAARLERMADGRVIKQPTGGPIQLTAITYDIETTTAGQLIVPVPPGAAIVPCDYHDVMLDIVRLFPAPLPTHQPSEAARKFARAEIRTEVDRYVRLPPIDLQRGTWQYLVVDIEPDVYPAPVFYTNPLVDGQLVVPTAISATGIVKYERQIVSRDVNDRVTQMLTRRQPQHSRPYLTIPNWTVYAINVGRIAKNEQLRAAGCSLHAGSATAPFWSCVRATDIPRAIVLGEIRSVYRLTSPEDHNEYLLL